MIPISVWHPGLGRLLAADTRCFAAFGGYFCNTRLGNGPFDGGGRAAHWGRHFPWEARRTARPHGVQQIYREDISMHTQGTTDFLTNVKGDNQAIRILNLVGLV